MPVSSVPEHRKKIERVYRYVETIRQQINRASAELRSLPKRTKSRLVAHSLNECVEGTYPPNTDQAFHGQDCGLSWPNYYSCASSQARLLECVRDQLDIAIDHSVISLKGTPKPPSRTETCYGFSISIEPGQSAFEGLADLVSDIVITNGYMFFYAKPLREMMEDYV